MKRAIVLFIENKKNLVTEMKALNASLHHILSLDTDLIVFGPKQALLRTPDSCIKIGCLSVSNRPQWKGYHFINSLACFTAPVAQELDHYDYLLRCDADTFLTPAWNNYYPQQYTCGKGGYVNDDHTKEKLLSISNKLGLKHKGIFNTGSTHYGPAKEVREVSALSVDIAQYIFKTEFKGTEGQWPGWFKGVTTMYSTDLAINHLIDDVTIDGDKLDFRSDSQESVHDHPHIHCWHTQDRFSKFAFERGDYNNINANNLNLEIISDYCTAMALKSLQK